MNLDKFSEQRLARPRGIIRYRDGKAGSYEATIVHERPLTVFLNGVEFATIICSPEAHIELLIGFLFSEGLIQRFDQARNIKLDEDAGLIWLDIDDMRRSDSFLRRNLASCCGRGRAGLYFINDARQLKDVDTPGRYTCRQLLDMSADLNAGSPVFKLSGGTHNAALGGPEGLICSYEDIGRHNAVDKVIGYMLKNGISPHDKALVLSGRVASEILIKAVRADIPMIVSRAAPTHLTLELADDFGISVIGFARGEEMNIYTHPERIIDL